VTNRLQTLELERGRLEQALADDPNWCAFLEAQKRRAAGLPGSGVPKEVARALAENRTVFAYLKVAEEIAVETANQSNETVSEQPEPAASVKAEPSEPPAFRTRVNVKTPPIAAPASTPTATTPDPSPSPAEDAAAVHDQPALSKTDAPKPQEATSVARPPVPNKIVPPRHLPGRDREPEIARESEPAAIAEAEVKHLPHTETTTLSPAAPQQVTTPTAPTKTTAPADDLTAIRSIDRALAAKLREIGVTTYRQIVLWDQHEVRQVRDALDLDKRIWQENWIEQAAILAMPGLDPNARHRPASTSPMASVPASVAMASVFEAAEQRTKAPPIANVSSSLETENDAENQASLRQAGLTSVTPSSQPIANTKARVSTDISTPARLRFKVGRRAKRLPAPAARRFTYIRGVSDSIAEAMRSAGVSSLADVAQWTRADVRWFRAILGEEARISEDQWIEQARLLANGLWTRHALRVVNGETRALVERPQDPLPILHLASAVSSTIQPPKTTHSDAKGGQVDTHSQTANVTVDHDHSTSRPSAQPTKTRSIDLGSRLRRPPPDLGMRWQQPVSLAQSERVSIPRPETQPQSNPEDAIETKPEVQAKPPANTPATSSPVGPTETAPVSSSTELMQRLAKASPPMEPAPSSSTSAPHKQASAREPHHLEAPLASAPREIDASAAQASPLSHDDASLSDDELARLVEADDWDDADALTIKPVSKPDTGIEAVLDPAPEPEEVEPSLTLPQETERSDSSDGSDNSVSGPKPTQPDSIRPVPALVLPSLDGARVLRQSEHSATPSITMPSPTELGSDFSWADEAEVLIVPRNRSTTAADAAIDSDDTERDNSHSQQQRASEPELAPSQERVGHSPEVPAQRLQDRRNNEYDRNHAGYHDAVDEATVTIIRAEASETDAASVVRTQADNDPDHIGAPERPTARKIGSRFLKALTGD